MLEEGEGGRGASAAKRLGVVREGGDTRRDCGCAYTEKGSNSPAEGNCERDGCEWGVCEEAPCSTVGALIYGGCGDVSQHGGAPYVSQRGNLVTSKVVLSTALPAVAGEARAKGCKAPPESCQQCRLLLATVGKLPSDIQSTC